MAGTTVITVPRVKIALVASLAAGDASAPSSYAVHVGTDAGIGVIPALGTAAGNINAVYSIAGVVTAGTPVTYDMTALTDPAGNAIPALARVQGICIENLSVTAGQNIVLAGGTSNPLFSDQHTVQPNIETLPVGGTSAIWNPYPGFTVSGTTKTIKVTAAAGTAVPYALVIFGCTV